MDFSEKLQLLRKKNGCSQEFLAEQCGVSRQAVSKWEMGSAYPSVDNILYLSELFKVSIDYLMKNNIEDTDITIPSAFYVNNNDYNCGSSNNNKFDDDNFYHGIIIKESIGNELILDLIEIERVEIWKTHDVPKYWTAIFFISKEKDFPYKLSNVLTGNWYVDMKVNNTKFVVFKDKVLQYEIGDQKEKESVIAYCKIMGIPDNQIDWPE